MIVKWHGILSSERKLYGGGPQGGIFGILEYLSQTNNILDFVEEDLRFKYFDDASVLEIVNLLSVGLASHLSKNSILNNIPEHNQFIPSEHLQSTEYLKNVHEWSTAQKMELNIEKSNMMLFNFTHDHQFTTEVNYKNENLKIVDEKKLLGTIITTDLKWHRNTQYIVKSAYASFSILHKISEFGASNSDMVTIYTSYIRSVLEQSCTIWHSSLTVEDSEDIERLQKCDLKVILKHNYSTYEEALETLMLAKLSDRRVKLCQKFARNCAKNPLTSDLFPKANKDRPKTRKQEEYVVTFANTERLKQSAVPFLQRLLNQK